MSLRDVKNCCRVGRRAREGRLPRRGDERGVSGPGDRSPDRVTATLEALRRHSRQIAARRVRRVQVSPVAPSDGHCMRSAVNQLTHTCVAVHGADAGWRARRRCR